MKNFKRLNLQFEINSMGISFYIPIVVVIILSFYILMTIQNADWLRQVALTFEFLLCPFATWWVLYLYYEFFEQNNEEILISYPVSAFYYGLFRSFLFFLCYFFLIALLLFIIVRISSHHLNLFFLIIRFGVQSFFYTAFGFCLMIAIRNIMAPILALIVYLSVNFFIGGDAIPLYQSIIFEPLDVLDGEIRGKLFTNLCLGVLFLLLGQIVLKKRMKKFI